MHMCAHTCVIGIACSLLLLQLPGQATIQIPSFAAALDRLQIDAVPLKPVCPGGEGRDNNKPLHPASFPLAHHVAIERVVGVQSICDVLQRQRLVVLFGESFLAQLSPPRCFIAQFQELADRGDPLGTTALGMHIHRQGDEWMNRWMNRWMDKWMDESMDGWMDGYAMLMDHTLLSLFPLFLPFSRSPYLAIFSTKVKINVSS